MCDIILFVHALLGCDTTSRIYGIGKPMALKMAATNIYFQQQATVFNCDIATKTDIIVDYLQHQVQLNTLSTY